MNPSRLLAALLGSLRLAGVGAADKCGSQNGGISCTNPAECCSEYGFCDIGDAWCGKGCQSGPCYTPDPTPPPTPPPMRPMDLTQPADTARAGRDSRLMAYAGNWAACPTSSQTDAYTHIAVAFAVTYAFGGSGKNICDQQCNIATNNIGEVSVCNNEAAQNLVDSWRNAGKKVILSFGGAGMGGSWAGDQNNCWDYCFGQEDKLSTALVNIVRNQRFDGIDIDYEYCYDTQNARHKGCWQVSDRYSDEKAVNFLYNLTFQLRKKLDSLRPGYYELTHAPLDSDMVPDSRYYQLLKEQSASLDFLMIQFYNGITRPVIDGFDGVGVGSASTSSVYSNIANDIFSGQPNKVVFGFCVQDCGASNSNANSQQAVRVLQQLKTYNSGEFSCHGGAFFWVAHQDNGGGWSDSVWNEVKTISGCSTSSDSNVEVIPIKFVVSGLPDDVQRASDVKSEMTTILNRIMLRLEERIPGFTIVSVVEQNGVKNASPLNGDEATVYYNVNVLRDDNKEFRGTVIQELRESSYDMLFEIPFSDIRYLSRDINYNWCTNAPGYALCVREVSDDSSPQFSAPQSTMESAPIQSPTLSSTQSDNSGDDGGGGLPGWATAIIVIICLSIVAAACYFAFRRMRPEQRLFTFRRDLFKRRNNDDLYMDESNSQDSSHGDGSQDQNYLPGETRIVAAGTRPSNSGWTHASESIASASYGSKRVVRDPSISSARQGRDPTMYVSGGRDPSWYIDQDGRPDPDTASVRTGNSGSRSRRSAAREQSVEEASVRSGTSDSRSRRSAARDETLNTSLDP